MESLLRDVVATCPSLVLLCLFFNYGLATIAANKELEFFAVNQVIEDVPKIYNSSVGSCFLMRIAATHPTRKLNGGPPSL